MHKTGDQDKCIPCYCNCMNGQLVVRPGQDNDGIHFPFDRLRLGALRMPVLDNRGNSIAIRGSTRQSKYKLTRLCSSRPTVSHEV